jgi:hypothetical protein
MTNTTKLMTKLALAIGLIGSLAFSAAAPSFARSTTGAFAHGPSAAQVLVNRQPQDGPAGQTWQNPEGPMRNWDAYGLRWD